MFCLHKYFGWNLWCPLLHCVYFLLSFVWFIFKWFLSVFRCVSVYFCFSSLEAFFALMIDNRMEKNYCFGEGRRLIAILLFIMDIFVLQQWNDIFILFGANKEKKKIFSVLFFCECVETLVIEGHIFHLKREQSWITKITTVCGSVFFCGCQILAFFFQFSSKGNSSEQLKPLLPTSFKDFLQDFSFFSLWNVIKIDFISAIHYYSSI